MPQKKSQWKAALAAVVLVLIVAGTLFYVKPYGLSSLPTALPEPSFEGLHVAFTGLQPGNQPSGSDNVYTANANSSQICPIGSCPNVQSVSDTGTIVSVGGQGSLGLFSNVYSWVGIYQPGGSTIQLCGPATSYGIGVAQGVSTECTSFAVTVNQFAQTPVEPVSYKVPYSVSGSNSYYQVDGEIYQTDYQIDLAVQPTTSSVYKVSLNDVLWMAVYSEGYNNIDPIGNLQLPDGTLTATWATPVLTYFTSGVNTGNSVANTATTPGIAAGNIVQQLWQTPTTTAEFSTLISDPQGVYTVQQQLASSNILAPDTQMIEYGFFPITLNDFGSYSCGLFNTGTCYNNLVLNFYTDTLLPYHPFLQLHRDLHPEAVHLYPLYPRHNWSDHLDRGLGLGRCSRNLHAGGDHRAQRRALEEAVPMSFTHIVLGTVIATSGLEAVGLALFGFVGVVSAGSATAAVYAVLYAVLGLVFIWGGFVIAAPDVLRAAQDRIAEREAERQKATKEKEPAG